VQKPGKDRTTERARRSVEPRRAFSRVQGVPNTSVTMARRFFKTPRCFSRDVAHLRSREWPTAEGSSISPRAANLRKGLSAFLQFDEVWRAAHAVAA